MVGSVTPLVRWVLRGVAVLRGVRVGLGGVVGPGVQVGSMMFRGVLLGGIAVGAAGVTVELSAGAAQLARKKQIPKMTVLIRFTPCLRAACGSFQHSVPARQPVDV
jgi:hypothetical protein